MARGIREIIKDTASARGLKVACACMPCATGFFWWVGWARAPVVSPAAGEPADWRLFRRSMSECSTSRFYTRRACILRANIRALDMGRNLSRF